MAIDETLCEAGHFYSFFLWPNIPKPYIKKQRYSERCFFIYLNGMSSCMDRQLSTKHLPYRFALWEIKPMTTYFVQIQRNYTGFDFGVCLHLDFLIFITFFGVQPKLRSWINIIVLNKKISSELSFLHCKLSLFLLMRQSKN